MTDLTEAVARAIENQLTAEDGWEVGTPQLKQMCQDFAQAAIAAMRAQLVPVAWMYAQDGCYPQVRTGRLTDSYGTNWTETALCAMPGDE